MTPRILLTGKDGQVGFELRRSLAVLGKIVAIGRAECDMQNPYALRLLVREVAPSIIVNAAAYTAVDAAEVNHKAALSINGEAPGILGEEAKRLNALVVHYSTDYVFDGTKNGAYTEADQPNPQSFYGKTKRIGEEALLASGADCLIFRTSWVFGAHGGNFAKTILRLAEERGSLKIVADQYGTPTSASLLADVTAQVISQYWSAKQQGQPDFPFGMYHLAASGVTNWHAYAQAVVEAALAAGKELKIRPETIEPITATEYPLPAARPLNSMLDTSRLQETFGLRMPPWQQGLSHVLQQIL